MVRWSTKKCIYPNSKVLHSILVSIPLQAACRAGRAPDVRPVWHSSLRCGRQDNAFGHNVISSDFGCRPQLRTVLDRDVTDFSIPLFANIHLCGSVLTKVLFVCVTSQLLYGCLPNVPTLIVSVLLLGVFAVGAPGVPGGTMMASLGIQ